MFLGVNSTHPFWRVPNCLICLIFRLFLYFLGALGMLTFFNISRFIFFGKIIFNLGQPNNCVQKNQKSISLLTSISFVISFFIYFVYIIFQNVVFSLNMNLKTNLVIFQDIAVTFCCSKPSISAICMMILKAMHK